MATPTVTVVMPTYDRLSLLRAAVSSVLAQSFNDLELLVVDDGSTDGTAEYLAGIDDPRVRRIALPHTGNVARARNAGAAQATGGILTFLDSDDLWLPRKLEMQLAATAGSSSLWSYTRYSHIDVGGTRIPARAGSDRTPSGRIARALLQTDAAVSIVTVAVPKALFDAVGGFNEEPDIREDYEFLVRLACEGDAVAVDEELALVRDHAARSTRAFAIAQSHEMSARTYDVLASRLQDPALRASARRRGAQHHAGAARLHLAAGAYGAGLKSLARAVIGAARPSRSRD